MSPSEQNFDRGRAPAGTGTAPGASAGVGSGAGLNTPGALPRGSSSSESPAPDGSVYRPLFAEAAVAFAVCAGMYLMWVSPAHNRLSEVRAMSDLKAAEIAAANSRPNDLAERSERLVQRATLLAEASRAAEDQTSALTMFNSLADRAGVVVQQMQQVEVNEPTSGEPNPSAPDWQTAYALQVSGTYADLANFLALLRTDAGLCRVVSVRLTPSGDANNPRVTASIETKHFGIDVASVRAALAGLDTGPGASPTGAGAGNAGGAP